MVGKEIAKYDGNTFSGVKTLGNNYYRFFFVGEKEISFRFEQK